MAGKHFFARFIVTVLVVGNLAAYYFLWPTQAPNPFTGAAPQDRTSLKREETAPLVPKALPDTVKLVATPPEPERPAPRPENNEVVRIPEVGGAASVIPAAPQQAEPLTPRPAPEEKKDPAPDSQQSMLERLKQASAVPATAEPAPMLNAANSPWFLQMEVTQGRTLLRARLHGSAEFKILCDRIDVKAPDGAVHAVGTVTLTGPGVTASCQRLSLPLGGEQMILEGQAEAKIQNAASDKRPAWELRGEQLTLRATGLTPEAPGAETKKSPAAPTNTPGVLPFFRDPPLR